MRRAAASLAVLLAAALASGCTDDAEDPQDHVDEIADEGMFGPSDDFEAHTVQLVTAASDKDVETLCADLEAALGDLGHLYWADAADVPGGEGCAYLTADLGEAAQFLTTGVGAAVPTRLHAWAEAEGSRLSYFDPAPLTAAVDSSDEAAIAFGAGLAEELAGLAAEVTGGAPETGEPFEATYTEIPTEIPLADLDGSLTDAAEAHGLRLLELVREDPEGTGGTYVFAVEGEDSALYEDLYAISPSIGAANPVHLHLWADENGNGVISYFDPAPLFRAVGEEFGDAGFEASTILSNLAWEAAAPA